MAGRFCFVERWPRLSGLILNDCPRLLTAFPTLEGEHLALYVSSERLTSHEGRSSPAVPASNRRDVSWDKRRLFGWSRHTAFPQIRRRERIGLSATGAQRFVVIGRVDFWHPKISWQPLLTKLEPHRL
jgi:hypothetical protein